MKHILIINAGQPYGHSGGRFNATIAAETADYFKQFPSVSVQTTHISAGYQADEESAKFLWADVIIYHTPIWWFQVPNTFKQYLDEVLSGSQALEMYHSDGRSQTNPAINYGTGGLMHGRHYMVTTSWNAPEGAFTLPGEFFQQTSVDAGPLFGFHHMNAFLALESLPNFHFYDVEKNGDIARDKIAYRKHLENVFQDKLTNNG